MVLCDVCGKPFVVSFRKRQGELYNKSDELFYEKISCDCGDLIYYNTKFSNWVFYPKLNFVDRFAREVAGGIVEIKGVFSSA
jgi:hypothetical protein